MGKYIVRRILLMIPTFLLVCVIVFTLMRMIPGSAVDAMVTRLANAGVNADREYVEQLLGMDKPYIQQFFTWVAGLLQGDLGDSLFEYNSVASILATKLPVTLELGVMTVVFSCLIAIPAGLFSAARQDSTGDYVVRVFSILMLSIPVFWLATMVVIFPAIWWRYSPPVTFVSILKDPITNMRMIFVPAFLAALGQSGMLMRTVRTTTLDVMRQDYVRTGWSKGLAERRVITGYAFRNAMIPTITAIGGSISAIVGGNVVMEQVFNIPGVGQTLVSALSNRDYPLVQGCVIVFALFVMVVNLVVDITYKVIDPRVSLE